MSSKTLRVGWAVGVLFFGACTDFNVVPVVVDEVTVLPTQVTVLIDETASFTVELRGPGGELLSGRTVSWSSTDPVVATVDSLGTVSTQAPGQTIIAAEVDGRLGTALVVVSEPIPIGPPTNQPSNLNANDRSSSLIELTWNDNSDDEGWFEVERRRARKGSEWGFLAAPPENSTSYDDTGLPRNTEYEYRVRACNSGGCSRYSNKDKAKTDA